MSMTQRMNKKRIKADQLVRHEALRFKKRSDLMAFALKNPGVLGAHFLLQVRQKMMLPTPSTTSELYRTDVAAWAMSPLGPGLKDLRDIREVQVLGQVLTHLTSQRIPQAVDLMAHRIREIRAAKAPGGSWDKAAPISLLPGEVSSSAVMPDSAMTL